MSVSASVASPPPYEDLYPDGASPQQRASSIPGGARPSVSESVLVQPQVHIVEKEPSIIRRSSVSSVDSVAEELRRDHAASLRISDRSPAMANWNDNPLAGEKRYQEGHEHKQRQDGEGLGLGGGPGGDKQAFQQVSHVSVSYMNFNPSPEPIRLDEPMGMDGRKRPAIIYRMHSARLNEYEEEQHQYAPLFTILVGIIDIVLFIITMGENNWKFEEYNINPMIGPSAQTEIEMGAKSTSRILDGEWWRLIAPMFLHAGLIHLLLNMIVLFRMAKDFEESFGTVRLVIIYLSSGVFGTILSCIFIPDLIGVGASGALYGLLGASWGDLFHNWSYMTVGRNWYIFRLVCSSLGGLCIGLLPYIDNFAHIGGFVCGVVAGSFVMIGSMRDPSSGIRRYRNKLLFIISLALFVVIFIIGLGVLYGKKDANKWCSWCHYMTCVPSPYWDCNVQQAQQCLTYPNGTVVECHPI